MKFINKTVKMTMVVFIIATLGAIAAGIIVDVMSL
jgi:hypothetical protein